MNTFKRIQEVVKEAKVDQGRSDYGKATIRNYRRKGPGHGEPAMFDPENKRGKLIDKRREEHKARRGVKGAKVPAYKVSEDYMSGQTGKIQKRTLAWMRKKGMKGSPGLDAMKAREAEHKAKRGVKEENALEKRAKENEKARKWLKKDAKDSGYTDIALKASLSKGAGVKEEVVAERLGGKGYKPYTSLTGKKVSGDWEDSDRGAGNKAKKRAGGTVKKKSPTYQAYVLNKEEVQITERAAKIGATDALYASGKQVSKTIGTVTGGLIGGLAGGPIGAVAGGVLGNKVGGKVAPKNPLKKEEFVNEIAPALAVAGKMALAGAKKAAIGAVKQKAKQVVVQKAANVAAGAIPQPNRDQQEGVVDLIKKGAKRHSKAVEKKKIKNRKAVPYAALGAGYEPEGNVIGEEGYDRMRDDRLVKYGIGHDGSDKKGSIKRAPETKVKGKTVLQKETEKKYGKGVSALDVVRKQIQDKHGKGAIMSNKK